MKKIMYLVITCFACFTFLGFATHNPAFASSKWELKDIDPHYSLLVRFSQKINFDTIRYNITLKHPSGQITHPDVILTGNQKGLRIVPPDEGYIREAKYTLEIAPYIESQSSLILKSPAIIDFTIANPILPSGLKIHEQELAMLINNYRISLGLKPLTISKSLTEVARVHIKDLITYAPHEEWSPDGYSCNLQSWSSHGIWTPVCYTDDHAFKNISNQKPRELTSYLGNGYELSYKIYSTNPSEYAKPTIALQQWVNNPESNAIITGQGYWNNITTMGVAIEGTHAHIWFGAESDPAGYYYLNDGF